MKVIGWTPFVIILGLLGLGSASASPKIESAPTPQKNDQWLPRGGTCDQLLKKTAYQLCYNSHHKLTLWSHHLLNKKRMSGSTKRTNDYRSDPDIQGPIVAPGDYARTGFDRGHLVPAADMTENRKVMSETFFMSNMTPQRPGFNRGIWSSLERLVRKLVNNKGEAIIISVSLMNSHEPRLPKGISIPSRYAKILFWPQHSEMVAFLIPNFKQDGLRPSDFQVSVNTVERESGLDLFWQLDDALEEKLEDQILNLF
jgi:endonuclease G